MTRSIAKIHLFGALPLVLSLTTPVAAEPLHKRASRPSAFSIVGRQVAAPPWSAACMSDHGPTECSDPMWVYGGPAEVARYRGAF